MADGSDRILWAVQAAAEEADIKGVWGSGAGSTPSSWNASIERPIDDSDASLYANGVSVVDISVKTMGGDCDTTITMKYVSTRINLDSVVEILKAGTLGAESKGFPDPDWKF